MNTYFTTGLIVSLIVRIERAICRPMFFEAEWNKWTTWIMFLAGAVIDMVLWPLAIVGEIILISRNK